MARTKDEPQSTEDGLRVLASAPKADERRLWAVLDHQRQRQMVIYFIENAGGEQLDHLLDQAAERLKFRKKSLRERPADELATMLERIRLPERYPLRFIYFWAHHGQHDAFAAFTAGIQPDPDYEGDDIAVLDNGIPIRLTAVHDSAKRMLAATATTDDALVIALLFYCMEEPMRPGLRAFLREVLDRPEDEVRAEAEAMLEAWRDENEASQNDWEEDGEAEPEADEPYADVESRDDVREALDDLRTRLADLKHDLEDAAKKAGEGHVPLPFLTQTLAETYSRFTQLRARAAGLAQEGGAELDPPVSDELQLAEIEGIVHAWQAAKDGAHTTSEARQVLENVLRLGHTDEGDFSALSKRRQEATELLAELLAGELGEDVQASLVHGGHSLAKLVDAVERASTLEGREATRLGSELSTDLGAELAFAVVLRQVVLRDEPIEQEDNEVEPVPQAKEPAGPDDKAPEEAVEEAPPAGGEDPNQQGLESKEPDEREPAPEPEDGAPETEETAAQEPKQIEGSSAAQEPYPPEPEPAAEPMSPAPGEPEGEEAEEAGQKGSGSPATALDREPLQVIAAAVLEAPAGQRERLGELLASRMIEEGHVEYAAHVARWSASEAETSARLPETLVHALALAPHVSTSMGPLFNPLRNDLAQHDAPSYETGDNDWDQGLNLLLTAATLRPALLAPSTLAPHVLKYASFKEGLGQLWEYCQFVAQQTESGTAIDPTVLKRVKDQAAWDRELKDLEDRAKDWASRAPRATMLFAAATTVWQTWQKPGEPIHSLIRPVKEGDFSKEQEVREAIKYLADPQDLRKLVDDTDRRVLGRTKGQPIIAKAYGQLQSKVGEALDLAREWLALLEIRPGETQTYLIEQATLIRREVVSRHKLIREDLDQVAGTNPPAIVRAGLAAVGATLDDIEAVFSGKERVSREEPLPDRVLNAPLLHAEGITLNDDWSLDGDSPSQVGEAVARMLATGSTPDWRQTFEMRTRMGDHIGSDLVLSLLERAVGPDAMSEIGELHRERQKRIAEDRSQVRRQALAVQQDVERALMHGLLRERDRADLVDRITRVEQLAPESLSFHKLRADLNEVSAFVERMREKQVNEVRDRMAGAGVVPGSEEEKRILEVLDNGDVLTANEYLHHVESELALPPRETAEDYPFDDFFPGAVRELDEWKAPNAAQIVRMVRNREDLPGINLAAVPETQAEFAADTLGLWYRARGRRGTPDREAIEAVFTYLGFNVRGVTAEGETGKGSTRAWVGLATEPVRDRARCPVATYGSAAASSYASDHAFYKVLAIWNEPSPEDLIGAVGDAAQEAPIFVLYFGTLGEKRRRALARLSRERRRTFLVIDELLLLYLIGQQEARMRTLFACTLPFTFIEPYVTTAGIVPPEAFYGRQSERQSVVDPHGSCFIYGGRQLGKTALLRHVERRFHDPASGRVALYLDLKSAGIGFDRPIEDFWQIMVGQLRALDVVDKTLPAHANPAKVVEEIRGWLDDDEHRRILLLLDEADRFIEADKDFTRVARLKGLMDTTGRRFKAVFAGLHNVQRSTRLANNPLAHLGEPLCIGPLFDDGEWRQARDLVTEPLEAAGYRLESPDLVTRILSQTNYYPSLLQLYGVQLLRHVNRAGVEMFDSRLSPPYVLTTTHVEDAYQSQELWQRIRERFIWTLDLDPRYRLIALLIAHEVSVDDEAGMRGFRVREVRESALNWWPQGFEEENSESTFRVLLEEMVGLGILRVTDQGAYTLRSANVGLLMGTAEEIEESLLNLSEQDAPTGYDPTTFRRPLPSEPERPGSRCSPLTAQQESELQERTNGVALILGTETGGLSDLTGLLRTVFGEEYYLPVSGVTSMAGFRAELDRLRGRKADGVTLMLVDMSCDWNLEWVEAALTKVRALRSPVAFVRIAFVAGPERVWSLAERNSRLSHLLEDLDVQTITMGPWHDAAVRTWLDELKVPTTLLDKHLATVRDLTGRWPGLLYELEQHLQTTAVGKWGGVFEEFAATWQAAGDEIESRRKAFGLVNGKGPAVLTLLGTVGPAPADDLADVGEMDVAEVEHQLLCANLLGLARRTGRGAWELDPIVRRSLQID